MPSGSIKGKANNYMVEVVDFDNESHTFEVDARSEAEASELAADMAMAAGLQVSWLRPKSAALGIAKKKFCHCAHLHDLSLQCLPVCR